MKVKSESEVTQSLASPWTEAYQAPLSMGLLETLNYTYSKYIYMYIYIYTHIYMYIYNGMNQIRSLLMFYLV